MPPFIKIRDVWTASPASTRTCRERTLTWCTVSLQTLLTAQCPSQNRAASINTSNYLRLQFGPVRFRAVGSRSMTCPRQINHIRATLSLTCKADCLPRQWSRNRFPLSYHLWKRDIEVRRDLLCIFSIRVSDRYKSIFRHKLLAFVEATTHTVPWTSVSVALLDMQQWTGSSVVLGVRLNFPYDRISQIWTGQKMVIILWNGWSWSCAAPMPEWFRCSHGWKKLICGTRY
jgi:hypothetical protein